MNKLFVTNSALAYPPPPRDMLGPNDAVLPLVERFEEALFMPSPFYADLHDEVPAMRAEALDLLADLADELPAAATDDAAWGHSSWDVVRGVLLKFSIGPLLANARLAQAAALEDPAELVGWEFPRQSSWWSGRQMVDAVAREIADRTGAPLTLRASRHQRALRALSVQWATGALASRYFRSRADLPPSPEPAPCDVLFANVGPTLLPLFGRIGERLRDQHGLAVMGVEVPVAPSDTGLTVDGLAHTHLYAQTTPAMLTAARREVRSATLGAGGLARRLRWSRRISHLGPELGEVFVRRVAQALIHLVPVAAYHARLWERLLDATRPRVLVTFNSFNEAIAPGVLQARHRGIPTVCCQHGIWGPLFRAASLLPYDDVVVFGEYAREILSPIAHERTRFTMTGHSDYDDAHVQPDLAPVPDGPPMVLVTTQPIGQRLMLGEPCSWVEKLAQACAELGARMVIKPHPHEADTSSWQALALRIPDTVTFVPHGERPLSELMDECTVLATRFSTTAMEANLLGKLVLTVYPTGGREQYPFAGDGAALKASSCDELVPCLRALLTDAATRERIAASRPDFIRRHIGPVDGGATERIAALIADRTSTP